MARKKPCERRFSTTFERKSTTFAAEAYSQNRSATNHSFFHRGKSLFADALFCKQPVVGRLFPVVLSNRLGMQRPKAEAMCRLTEKKGAGFVRLIENGTFARAFRLPLASRQAKRERTM